MTDLLISWCVTSSILLAVFLLLRGTLFRRLSPRVRYALWIVVLLRLLAPFQIPGLSLPASAANLAPELPVLSTRPLSPDTAMGYGVIPSDRLEENGLTIADDGTVQTSRSDQDTALWELQENGEIYMYFGGPTLDDALRAAVVLVWGAGVGVVLLAVLAANLRFAQKLRKSRRPLPTAGCPLPVYEAEGLSSPCLCGVLRPAVYLTPEAAEDGTVRTHVLSHELTHFRHRDHIWSLLRCLALALHWYNPLVWAAVILSKRDGELSCDEGTIARLGEAERIPYGRTLIGLVARRSGAGGVLSCSTTMTGGKKTVQRRIAQLVKQPETKKTALFLAAASLALAAVFVFAGERDQAVPDPDSIYSDFKYHVSVAQAVHLGQPLYSSGADPTQITDPDLLAEAKELLNQVHDLLNFSDEVLETDWPSRFLSSTPLTFWYERGGEMEAATYYLYRDSNLSDPETYVLNPDSEHLACFPAAVFPDGIIEQIRVLQQEQRTLPQVQYRVEYPVFKTQLTELFLNDPACVEQNASPDYDMEDWLTNWTTFYEVSYGVPWWDPSAPEGWYARAMDAGSWYTIAIPDHLVDAVLEICWGAAQDTAADAASSSEMAAALEQTVSLHASFGPLSSFIGPPITDSDLVNQAKEILRSGDPQSDTTAFADLYYGSSVEFFGADGHSLGRYPLSNRDMCSALGSLAHEQMERNQIADTLASADYLQAETVLIPALLSDPDWETAVKTLDYQPEDWSAWLSLCLESLGLAPYYNPEAELFIFNSPTGTRISLPESLLQPQELFSRSASPTRVTVSSSSADVEEAAASFGTALAQFYLDLDPRHPKAVTSARLAQAEVYDTGETAFCARITLALDPVEPNTVYWMAGAGIDLAEANSPWAGLWLDTLEYRLERQADGSWRCTEAATGGLRAD